MSGGPIGKRSFSLAEYSDRALLKEIKIGAIVKIRVNDEQGKEYLIAFRVNRNSILGSKTRKINGMVVELNSMELNSSEDDYSRIEICLYDDMVREDTVETYPHAPPILPRSPINVLR